jgi:hypothetical protein
MTTTYSFNVMTPSPTPANCAVSCSAQSPYLLASHLILLPFEHPDSPIIGDKVAFHEYRMLNVGNKKILPS